MVVVKGLGVRGGVDGVSVVSADRADMAECRLVGLGRGRGRTSVGEGKGSGVRRVRLYMAVEAMEGDYMWCLYVCLYVYDVSSIVDKSDKKTRNKAGGTAETSSAKGTTAVSLVSLRLTRKGGSPGGRRMAGWLYSGWWSDWE